MALEVSNLRPPSRQYLNIESVAQALSWGGRQRGFRVGQIQHPRHRKVCRIMKMRRYEASYPAG